MPMPLKPKPTAAAGGSHQSSPPPQSGGSYFATHTVDGKLLCRNFNSKGCQLTSSLQSQV